MIENIFMGRVDMMDKKMSIFLMVVFGVSGIGVTALAWLCPSLQLDKVQASLAGLIGIAFLIFQSVRLKRSSQNTTEVTE